MKEEGLRYNEGKTRFDLISPFANEQLAKVVTFGATKYAEHNWQRGMAWSKVIASLKRHLAAVENGEDFDKETGLLHSAHIQCNAMFLTEYYKIFPQGDDRFIPKPIKIGLDVDDVLADFVGAWVERYNCTVPTFWGFDYGAGDKFDQLKDDKEFWMNIKPKINPSDIPFEPYCYVTSRIIPKEWTMEWLQNNGFACSTVISLGHGVSKLDEIQKSGIDIFVDDRYDTWLELNRNGICCFLLTAEHNKRHEVGFKRINSLMDLSTMDHLRNV